MISVDVKCDNSILQQIKNAMREMDDMHGEAGFYQEMHPNGRGATAAEVANFNEYGTEMNGEPHIPARPFFKPAAKQSKASMKMSFDKIGFDILSGKRSVLDGYDKLAKKQAAWIKERILFNNYASRIPNAPSTVEQKGFNRPLYETGWLADNVRTKVRREDE